MLFRSLTTRLPSPQEAHSGRRLCASPPECHLAQLRRNSRLVHGRARPPQPLSSGCSPWRRWIRHHWPRPPLQVLWSARAARTAISRAPCPLPVVSLRPGPTSCLLELTPTLCDLKERRLYAQANLSALPRVREGLGHLQHRRDPLLPRRVVTPLLPRRHQASVPRVPLRLGDVHLHQRQLPPCA